MSEITSDDLQKIRAVLLDEVTERPPTIAVVGVSGVGKSSTINSMFKTQLKVSHTVAGTKEFDPTDLSLKFTKGEASGESVNLRVIDAPGLGEDKKLDPSYIKMYKENLPLCDVILWVMSARNRAIALDQMYLEEFKEYGERIVFGINQVDLVHPIDWNESINLPSIEMEQNINEIVKDRSEKLSSYINSPVKIMAYSAQKGYQLEQLFELLIDSIPNERRWIFDGLKNFSYKDFIPAELNAYINDSPKKPKGKSRFFSFSKLFGQE